MCSENKGADQLRGHHAADLCSYHILNSLKVQTSKKNEHPLNYFIF